MEEIYKLLIAYPKRTIGLSKLQEIFNGIFHTYDEFSEMILKLEEHQILHMVKSKGRNTRNPSLAYQYRIDKSRLTVGLQQEIQHYRHQLHPTIRLDEYYRMDPHVWKHDLPYILKIDEYVKTYGFPKEMVPAPERSFEIMQDEKWITEKDGKEILERIALFDQLKISPVSDPLMFAINPRTIHTKTQYHLIVENKTTYQGLLPALTYTQFSTLIYGSGKKVIHSIEQFSNQYPIEADHIFFYFGDLDREGISIWYSLAKKTPLILAMPFYEACLKKAPVSGKEYQKQFKEAQASFYRQFPEKWKDKLKDIFSKGIYYPQEILNSKELQKIWRESDWKTLKHNN